MMTNNASQRRFLVVGGTGMLAPLCQALPPKELVIAVRFVSHHSQLLTFSNAVQRVELDYHSVPSANGFLQNLALWPNMQSCILWVHPPAQSFSQAVIQAFAQRRKPPHIIEVLGSQATPTDLSRIAKLNPIRRTTVRLGRHQESTGGR
ncbi:MAG: short-chain dehydrogenase [Marinovum sp.]|nr:short-chain dehydrogenase [Marinovum sp.]